MVRRNVTFADPPAPVELLDRIDSLARPLQTPTDLDPLLQRIGDARYVLLGEASHGTHEYYTWRTALTRRLIHEKGFSFIAVEGDWPDCYRVNRYVKGYSDAGDSAREVLHAFERWPTWMWANEEIIDLAEWLRFHNSRVSRERQVGFYGLDVYSLWDSLYQVLGYLRNKSGAALDAARQAFRCFESYGEDVQRYAWATRIVPESCEQEVVNLLRSLREQPAVSPNGDREAQFVAEQNALVLKNAEAYYRTMVQGQAESWNIRDRHMTQTLERLTRYHGPTARGIVWEHNTHIGDARWTDMADDGMVNVGQLIRERHKSEGVVLVGFGSHRGSVIAATEWEAPEEKMTVPPAQPGSWEDVLHHASATDKLMLLDEVHDEEAFLRERGHRAIGVVYHPEYEYRGNYVPTILPHRYDAFLYLDQTEALRPLPLPERHDQEAPETYPSGV